jgi:putative membrane protein
MNEAPGVPPPSSGARAVRFLSVLALVRTSYSSERSLMAWIRTSISLYTFGFTITKFIDYLKMREPGIEFSAGLQRLGFVLICLGMIALVPAGIEHLKRIRTMKKLGLPQTSRPSLPLVTVVALIVLGVATVISIAGVWSS